MYLYLAINIASFTIPFLYSFQKKMNFIQHWKPVFLAIIMVAIPFLIWDVWFTKIGVWGFNQQYLLGFNFFYLPIEEILFFLCIPYASIFTHYALLHFFPNLALPKQVTKVITVSLILASILILFFNFNKWYTLLDFAVFTMLLTYSLSSKNNLLSKFFITFLVILIPFFIVNGVLTGSFIEGEIVWYNNFENLGVRLGTIPLEDVFYAFSMLYSVIILIEKMKPRFKTI